MRTKQLPLIEEAPLVIGSRRIQRCGPDGGIRLSKESDGVALGTVERTPAVHAANWQRSSDMDDQTGRRLRALSRRECVELLRSQVHLGRVGYVVDGVPVILPVNFAVDGESVVFVTARGRKLSWLDNHMRVAFQVDHGRPLDESGWSVLVHGIAQQVTDPAELEQLRAGPLHSWAIASDEHFVRISFDEVSGRRLHRRVRTVGRG